MNINRNFFSLLACYVKIILSECFTHYSFVSLFCKVSAIGNPFPLFPLVLLHNWLFNTNIWDLLSILYINPQKKKEKHLHYVNLTVNSFNDIHSPKYTCIEIFNIFVTKTSVRLYSRHVKWYVYILYIICRIVFLSPGGPYSIHTKMHSMYKIDYFRLLYV